MSGRSDGKILPGVAVAGIDLGGLTSEMAGKVLKTRFGTVVNGSVILVAGDRKWEIPLEKIGASYDYRKTVMAAFAVGHSGSALRRISQLLGNEAENVAVPLPFVFNMDALKKELVRINGLYAQKPRNARLVEYDGKISLVSGMDGNEMDMGAAIKRILSLRAGSDLIVQIPDKTVRPQITDKDIAGLTDVLGECTTRFEAGSLGRVRNIARASEKLNGSLVKPGEVFSFNSVIAPVNQQNGYLKAPVIEGDQLVDDYGGGVCQVSTTLYGAVLLSGLEVVERHPHSKPVKYVSPGLDDTVASGLMDLRFRNNTGSPVYIISATEKDKGYVKITIAGKKENNAVCRIETNVKDISPGIVIKGNSRLKRGESRVVSEGSPGFEATVYRVTTDFGVEKKELVSKDYYQPDPRVIEVGVTSGVK